MLAFLGVWLSCGIMSATCLQLAGTLDLQKLVVCLVGGPILMLSALCQASGEFSRQENEDG